MCGIYNLGKPYGESKGSRERYRVARDHGHVGAAVKIVTHIRDGADTQAEPRRAINEFRPLTKTLSPEAMANLGRTLVRFGKQSEKSDHYLCMHVLFTFESYRLFDRHKANLSSN